MEEAIPRTSSGTSYLFFHNSGFQIPLFSTGSWEKQFNYDALLVQSSLSIDQS